MGKNKYTDPVIEYLNELDIRMIKSPYKFQEALKEAGGNEWAEKIIAWMDKRATKTDTEETKQFYEFKNSNPKGSVALTGAIDGDVIRRFCEWIINHKERFGSTILEVGCDVGILSCFIARTFPEAQVTSIDRCESAIHVAEELAKKLNITNVTFLHRDAVEMTGTFDTVFTARTIHENFETLDVDDFALIKTQGEVAQKVLTPYAEALTKLVNKDGDLISLERSERSPLLLGWMWALSAFHFAPDLDCYENINCREVERESVFQAMVFDYYEEPINKDDIYDAFCATFLEDIDLSAAIYKDWEAAVMLQNSIKELIEGYEVYNVKDHNWKFAHYSLWTAKHDPEALIVYIRRADSKLHVFENHYLNTLPEMQEWLHNLIKDHSNVGYKVSRLKYENGEILPAEDELSK